MAVFNLKAVAWLALTIPFVPAAHAAAATRAAPQQAIALDAQSSEIDMKNNFVVFKKVHIAQGSTSISAEQGQANRQASGLDFDNSLWVFRGNVKITMDDGQLSSDEADVTFARKQLSKAVVKGKPANFEQRVAKTGKLAHGRADSIEYDVNHGVVHLSSNAFISDGQNEIHGESLKYNVLAQTIIAEAAEQGSQRVHIVITPPPAKP